MAFPPTFLKEFADELASVLVVFFASFLFPALILLLGSMHLFSLFLGRVTAPTPPTIAPVLSFRLLLRFSKLCLTPTSSNISNLTFLFQITSMVSVRQDLQGIFFPILLVPGHPPSGTLENHSASLLMFLRHLRVWHKALLAKLPAYGFTPSFCNLISSFLSYRFISVVVDGTIFASFPVSSGVLQDSVLSPTLFLLFINDLLHASASDIHSLANVIQHYINLLPSSASLPLMLVFNLVLLCLQLLTQICRAFPSGEPII